MGFAMLLPAGLIYQHNKTRKGALIGMAVGHGGWPPSWRF